MSRFKNWRLPLVALLLLFVPLANLGAQQEAAKVYVILWFDTEDYILPASDEATLRIARFLTAEWIRAVFKVVGERALSFERRQRNDVIDALKKHEIGFHSRWHSVQPTPAQYLSTLDWYEGVAEFDRREKPGYDDVKRIFGTSPTCYGQPGSSWGPQSYGAMKKWGMDVYLDSGRHIDLDSKPYYYGGILNLYRLEHVTRADLTKADKLGEAEDKFLAIRKKCLADGGGIVSIYYHPCEFVHKQFWDGANFTKGANPPREQWKQPAAKTAEETRIAFDVFQRYVRFIKHFPEVQFVTATEALQIYRDKAKNRSFSQAEVRKIAAEVGDKINFQRHGDYALSPSEVLSLLNQTFIARNAGKIPDAIVLKSTPTGPALGKTMNDPVTTDLNQFGRTALDVQDSLAKLDRVPTTVWLGSAGVSPEAYLRTLAELVVFQIDGKPLPRKLELQPTHLAAGDCVAEDDPRLWGWVIFPPGFRAPEMMALAKRQTWTLKPAILDREVRIKAPTAK